MFAEKRVSATSRAELLYAVFILTFGAIACSDRNESSTTEPGLPTQGQMTDCAVADADDPPVVESYWPPGTFAVREDIADDFVRNWYSTQLCAMGEAPLAPPNDETVRIRFLWLPSFRPAVSVRVEHMADKTNMTATELDGAGGHAAGRVSKRTSRDLSAGEWASLEETVVATDIWNLPTKPPPSDIIGLDGSQWIFEIATGDKYHVVDRWSAGELETLGRHMLELSELGPGEVY